MVYIQCWNLSQASHAIINVAKNFLVTNAVTVFDLGIPSILGQYYGTVALCFHTCGQPVITLPSQFFCDICGSLWVHACVSICFIVFLLCYFMLPFNVISSCFYGPCCMIYNKWMNYKHFRFCSLQAAANRFAEKCCKYTCYYFYKFPILAAAFDTIDSSILIIRLSPCLGFMALF